MGVNENLIAGFTQSCLGSCNRRTLAALSFAAEERRRNGMLEDQLLLVAILEHNRIFVIAADPPAHASAIQQVHGHVPSGLQRRAEERLLNACNGHGNLPRISGSLPGESTTASKNTGIKTICPIYNWDVFHRI